MTPSPHTRYHNVTGLANKLSFQDAAGRRQHSKCDQPAAGHDVPAEHLLPASDVTQQVIRQLLML